MKSEEITFRSGDSRLAGTLYKPETSALYPAIVAVHPASEAERSSPFYEHLKVELPEYGIAVFIFDRRGSGASEGNFETADFDDLASDVISAVEYLQSRMDIDPMKIGLHGTSQGAWIAPIAASRKPDIACIVAVSASGVSPADQMNYGVAFHLEKDGFDRAAVDKAIELRNLVNEYFRGHVSREQAQGELARFEHEPWYERAYLYPASELPADITRSKWHYEMDYEPLSVWRGVDQPTLFLFAEMDEWVPIKQSIMNYRKVTRHLDDVTFEQIPGTDHLLRDQRGEISRLYLDTLIPWLKSRLFSNLSG
ncbi:MAG TPA: alpha/beta fold hydrolase [Anaerolineales bacterium]|nr:alpha/beta fold hydrolase [Anaerolineales bacterium]